jgi:hypothetical protein
MKNHFFSFTVFLSLIAGTFAEEVTKPLVSLTVNRHLLDSELDHRGPRSESREKEITLRVEVRNISDKPLEGAELTGEVLLKRAFNNDERIVKESLKSLKLPPMKPNENLTVDLGKFTLSKSKWKNRTFEETLEEWKVVCKNGEINIGQNVSDEKYYILINEMKEQREEKAEKKKDEPETPFHKKKFRKLRD